MIRNEGISRSDYLVRNWEQGRRSPQGPAITLLRLLQKQPRMVIETLND